MGSLKKIVSLAIQTSFGKAPVDSPMIVDIPKVPEVVVDIPKVEVVVDISTVPKKPKVPKAVVKTPVVAENVVNE